VGRGALGGWFLALYPFPNPCVKTRASFRAPAALPPWKGASFFFEAIFLGVMGGRGS